MMKQSDVDIIKNRLLLIFFALTIIIGVLIGVNI